MNYRHIQQLVDEYCEQMTIDRRYLHRNPELSYKEFETTEFLTRSLKKMGIEVNHPLETGCVGIIRGGIKSDRVVALRADIDALPIQEEGVHKKEFLSRTEGVAHCCGHDAHTANLLGTARVLKKLKSEIEGTVLLIFQPAEEKLPGGGRLLCESGYLQERGVDVIYGLHTSPHLPPGKIAVRKGPMMARPDEFRIEIIGSGGHAAAPHQAVDPIVVASQVVSQLQTIVSRSVNPTEPAVVTVGKIAGGSAHNVIPESVEMLGTVRTFSKKTALTIKDHIQRIVKGVTEAAGAEYRFTFDYGYPAVNNTGWTTDRLIDTAGHLIGEENVELMDEPIMAGEDFAFYQQNFPGTFFFLGSGSPESGSTWPWHHPKYNVDERCFRTGAALMAGLVFQPIREPEPAAE